MDKAMTQIKFTIESNVISDFRSRCESEGVSMASEIRRYMQTAKPVKVIKTRTQTRPQRRIAIKEIIQMLNDIMESEACYRDNIPEHFSQRIESAEHACSRLEEAIECLEEAFMVPF